MATTYYVSANDFDTVSKDPANAGTSSTATDIIELRMGDGTTVPTQRQVVNALDIFKRWLIKDGLGAGANLPPNRG